jgi:hypothetical protein
MKCGLGLCRHMLTTDSFRIAKQAGATHLIANAAMTIIEAE